MSSSVPSPGPMARAVYFDASKGKAKYLSWTSLSTMASGMVICIMGLFFMGVWTVSRPTPERRQALEARMAAPAMP